MLSRIDGMVTESELALMTGFDTDQVRTTVDRLAELGAVHWEGMPPRERRKGSGSQVATRAMEQMERPAVEAYSTPPIASAGEPSRALYDPAELDEDVEISQEKRRRILDMFYQLEELSFYELLGVEPTADKKAIKSAYYRLAGEFHPDKHFRKRLGGFKPKMEAVFGRVTLAHDTLTKREEREEYDAYLATQRATRQLEASIREGARLSESMAKELVDFVTMGGEPVHLPTETPASSSAAMQSAATSVSRSGAATSGPSPTIPATQPPPPSSPGSYGTAPVRTRENDQARREALAARLGAGRVSRPPGAKPSSKPPEPPRGSLPPDQAAEDLRRRMLDRQQSARRAQVGRYVETATKAMQQGDPAAAANAYRLAISIAPEDPVLQQAFKEAEASAATLLADGYLKQGAYEEKAERWKEAALSFARAAAGMPNNADVQHRVAQAMMRADMDLRRAAEYAGRAIGMEPKTARYRVTLGQIYLAADMRNNARRELEVAAELAPDDATIASLLKAVRKGP